MPIIFLSIAVLGGMAVIFGVGLGYAGVKFEVKEDERIAEVRNFLPGANCGACGFIGCDDLAAAIVNGSASPNSCPAANAAAAVSISEIMGVEATTEAQKIAIVKCGANQSNSTYNYRYEGLNSCMAAAQLSNGGSKACRYGCIGGGSCVTACKFDAVSIVDGLAVINEEKCTACGMCVKACPKNLIELIPQKSSVRVLCNSCDNGKTVRANCSVGCIGCKMCEKVCKYDAVSVKDFLAKIDYSKCTLCGECVKKCPTKSIDSIVSNLENTRNE